MCALERVCGKQGGGRWDLSLCFPAPWVWQQRGGGQDLSRALGELRCWKLTCAPHSPNHKARRGTPLRAGQCERWARGVDSQRSLGDRGPRAQQGPSRALQPCGTVTSSMLSWHKVTFENVNLPLSHNLSSPACKSLVKVKSLSRVQLFVTPWTVAYQAPLSVGFSRQEC